ncbi:MAG: hypothetical protein R3Y56_00670 [Akkermansia sp.]
MFIFVLVANMVSALMVCCGAIQMYHVIDGAQQSQGAYLFFSQLGQACLPMLGGVMLYGLIQIAQLLEQLTLTSQFVEEDRPAPVSKAKAKKKISPASAEPFFGSAVSEENRDAAQPSKRPLPPIPNLEIIPDPDEAPRKEKNDDGMSFFHMN